jgi:hypothetical protein
MIDESKLIRKASGYQLAPRGGITDKVLLEVAGQYQNSISQKFLTASAKDLAARYAGDEKLLVTTKYDGEGVFIYFEAGRKPFDIFAFNTPSGRVRVGLPALQTLAVHLTKKKVQRALLRAELYLPGQLNGRRLGVSEAVRVSFSGTEAEIAQLKLALFDVIMLDGKDLRSDAFEPVWSRLQDVAGSNGCFHCAEGAIVAEKDVAGIFEKTIAAGQEGIVIRRLHRLELVKVKPHVTVDAAVIGYVEGDFEGNYGVLSLLTGLTYPDKKDGQTFYQVMARVGSGFSDQLRQELLTQLGPLKVSPPLAMTDSDGRTVHFVKPQLVAEIDGEDLVTATREDKENKTQLLTWDGKAWTFRQLAPCPRVVFPTFSRLRPDKEIGAGGARLQQLLPNVSVPPVTAAAKSATKIVRREVYTKESKGETMVRKLVVAHTEGDPETFPFVIWWTDFSAKRKEPLKVDVAFAATQMRADALAKQFLDEGIAKGWVKAA